MTQPHPAPTERVRLLHVTEDFAYLHERPTFTQIFGARILNTLMGVIFSLVVAFLLGWLLIRPTLIQVKEVLATYLATLGNRLRHLGEREAARDAHIEALEIYRPFVEQWPQAFGQNFFVVLRNYCNLTGENAHDPWWQLWSSLQEDADTTGVQES